MVAGRNYRDLYREHARRRGKREEEGRVPEDPDVLSSRPVVLDTFVKVPGKLSEVLGDVLELACGGGGSGSSGAGGGRGSEAGGKSSNSSIGNAASRIGAVAGMTTIRWRSPLSSVANTDSTDSTTSTSSEVSTFLSNISFPR